MHSGSISIQRRMTAMEIDEKKNAETLELMDMIRERAAGVRDIEGSRGREEWIG